MPICRLSGFSVIVLIAASMNCATLAQQPGEILGGTGQSAASRSAKPAKRDLAKAPIGLGGLCPVTINERRQWKKGDEKFAVVLDGRRYLFPSEQEKARYLSNTVKYTPVLSGDCIVSATERRQRLPGSVHHTAFHKGRLYLFVGAEEKRRFMAEPEKYENNDMVFDGKCVVTKVDSGQDLPGSQIHGTVWGGMVYLFTSRENRMKFLKQPTKYVTLPPTR